MAIKQTQQTQQTLPTNKVGQAFHALKGALGLHIEEAREKIRSGGYDNGFLPFGWSDVDELLDRLTCSGNLSELTRQVAVDLDMNFLEEIYLLEGFGHVVDASLAEDVVDRAVARGMTQYGRFGVMVPLAKRMYRATEWAETFLETEVEKESFSTADPRSWL
ncbi:hypothetical protein [Streptococcus suis]|uniref:hypothetical protein n=1 Tax=Streptococcus suis TaxID=1307 RepID=UPI001478576E